MLGGIDFDALGGKLESTMQEKTSKVTLTTERMVLDGNELEGQVAVVVAVADAVVTVEADPQRG